MFLESEQCGSAARRRPARNSLFVSRLLKRGTSSYFSSTYITATAFKVETFLGSVYTSDMLLARVHGFKIAAANFRVGVFQEIVLPSCFVC